MISLLFWAIDLVVNLLILLLVLYVILSFFMKPWHPFRMWVDRMVEPMLAPIRRVVPPLGGLDFSPLVLLLIVQLLAAALKRVLLLLLI